MQHKLKSAYINVILVWGRVNTKPSLQRQREPHASSPTPVPSFQHLFNSLSTDFLSSPNSTQICPLPLPASFFPVSISWNRAGSQHQWIHQEHVLLTAGFFLLALSTPQSVFQLEEEHVIHGDTDWSSTKWISLTLVCLSAQGNRLLTGKHQGR